jgi:hypothetical protein
MKIAVMQPYFFPYIGYFELMAAVDVFVFLNDVQYIRQGWVNRNRIRSKNKPFQYLTVPVVSHPRDSLIKDIQVVSGWTKQHLKILDYTYGVKSHPLRDYFSTLRNYESLREMLCDSLIWTARYLGIKCDFHYSDGISTNHKSQKIKDICQHFNANEYFNLNGGMSLYSNEDFSPISLNFMKPTTYQNHFSILDLILEEENEVKLFLAQRS